VMPLLDSDAKSLCCCSYRGHAVLQTLIRAYFSPAATTGQRYIYSGSADGSVYIWGARSRFFTNQLQHIRAAAPNICGVASREEPPMRSPAPEDAANP